MTFKPSQLTNLALQLAQSSSLGLFLGSTNLSPTNLISLKK